MINAILWLNYTGSQWCELSKKIGSQLPWQSVYYHFQQFKRKPHGSEFWIT
ncbi:transposase [Spirosoma fluminis]